MLHSVRATGTIIAAFLALGAAVAPVSAQSGAAGYNYTCIAQVSTIPLYPLRQDSLGGFKYPPSSSGTLALAAPHPVSGSTLSQAVGACHAFTRQVFQQNTAWSNPDQVCARYAPGSNTMTVLVYATDYFQEMCNSAGVNRVDGFAKICAPTTPTVIPHTL
jgi:hypothetical protein